MLVAGIKTVNGLTVKQMQQLRKALPQDTTLIMVAKNKLIGIVFVFSFRSCNFVGRDSTFSGELYNVQT